MAGETADPFIVWIKALAFRKSVRLEAYVSDAWLALRGNFRPCAVTITAEIGYFLGRGVLELKGLAMGFACWKRQSFFRRNVRIEIGMAVCALHSGNQGLQRKLTPRDSIG